jgi:Na+-driven multidrug efflux pump
MVWCVVGGVGAAVALVAARPLLPQLFTSDPEVTALCAYLLLWVAALQPVNAVVFALDGVLIGAGDQRYLAWAMVAAAAVFVPVAVSVRLLDLGIGWLWAALTVLMAARLVALMGRFLSGGWAVTGALRPRNART